MALLVRAFGTIDSSQVFCAVSAFNKLTDTGTTLLYLPQTVVTAYYNQVPGASYNSNQGGYTFPCSTTLPSITLGLGSYRAVVPGSYINYAPVSGSSKL